MAPFVKTGGLADVSAALPKALVRLGHRVTVVLPRHAGVPIARGELVGAADVPLDGTSRSAGFFRMRTAAGVDVVFVEYPPFYDRPTPYGHDDDRLRYAFLARAALEYFRLRGDRPDVIHAHDWQAGLVPVYLKASYWDDPILRRTPSVFTIHNVAYQGQFGMDTVALLGLPGHLGSPASPSEYHGGVSYLKGGTVFAEMVSTVSPTYALEIQGPEHGFGFEDVVRSRAGGRRGDPERGGLRRVGPRNDRRIAKRYSAARLGRARRPARRTSCGRSGCPADPGPAAGGRDLAPRLAEGLRHRGRRVVGPAPPTHAHGRPRHRRPRRAGRPGGPRPARPEPLRRPASPTTRPCPTA